MHWLCLKGILQRKSLLSILDSENVIPAAAFGPSMSITSLGWKSKEDAENYIRNQLKHHNVKIIDDRQNKLTPFTAE